MRRIRCRYSLRFAVTASALAALGLAPAAVAAPSTPTTSPTPSQPPALIPAKAEPALYLGGLFTDLGRQVTVPGQAVTVTGVIVPYVPNQQVLLKATVNGRLFAIKLLKLTPSPRHVYGGFKVTLSSPAPGNVAVSVLHSPTATLTGFLVHSSYTALGEQIGPGSVGRMVVLLQQRLAALHFYIPQTGVYNLGTELAVDAYHRMLGAGTSELADPAMISRLLDGDGSFQVRFPNQGRHVEGDLSDQLLALTNGSQVQMIFPISSGKPSTPTILGSFRIYSRVPGYLPDGMYYSDFFITGYAVHGYDPAPDYPASHGCMRLPIVDAITVYDWLALGDWVDTYYT